MSPERIREESNLPFTKRVLLILHFSWLKGVPKPMSLVSS